MPESPIDIRRCRDFNYRLLEPLDGRCARVEFDGSFEQAPVFWQATILALKGQRPFIEIDPQGPGESGALAVRIGLAVDVIDAATICKAMIMMRNYKRLRRGRMEFGEPRA